MNPQSNQPDLHAYIVTGSEEKPFFTKIGAAWKNSKGGFGLRLDATPTKGDIVLLPPRAPQDDSPSL